MPFKLSRRQVLGAALLSALQFPARAIAATAPAINLTDTGGSGKPTLLFIHGYARSLEDWAPQVEGLSATHRCIAMDLPGHGKSPRSDEATIAALARGVSTTLESLRLKDVILVAHSMGCRVAAEAYMQSPSRIGGIAWLDGSLLASNDPEAAVKRISDMIDKTGIGAVSSRVADGAFVESTPAELRAQIKARQPNVEVDPGFWKGIFVDTVRWDGVRALEALKAIAVPTLIIQSTMLNAELKRVSIGADSTTPWMTEVAKSVRKSRAERVLGAGHFVMLEASTKVNDLLAQFVRGRT